MPHLCSNKVCSVGDWPLQDLLAHVARCTYCLTATPATRFCFSLTSVTLTRFQAIGVNSSTSHNYPLSRMRCPTWLNSTPILCAPPSCAPFSSSTLPRYLLFSITPPPPRHRVKGYHGSKFHFTYCSLVMFLCFHIYIYTRNFGFVVISQVNCVNV